MTMDLDLTGGTCRKPAAPTVVAWTCDANVPAGIRAVAEQLGARACRIVRGLIVVVLRDERCCWLNFQGEQTGRDSMGAAVPILEDVPWPMASVAERTRAA